MQECYLEVTYRNGKPLAAYYYLPRNEGDMSARVEKHGTGLLVDVTSDGRPIGVEITIPALATVDVLNQVLQSYGFPSVAAAELAPLQNAA